MYKRKLYDLSPLPQRAIISLSNTTASWWSGEYGLVGKIVSALIILIFAGGIVALIRQIIFSFTNFRTSPPFDSSREPIGTHAQELSFSSTFPLTGHLPTDVRQVLYG